MKRGLKISLAAVLLLAVAAGVVWYSKPSSPESTVATSGEHAGEHAVSAPIETPLPEDAVIDRLVVHKSKRTMSAYSKGKLLKTYPIALGKQPVGHKHFEGDGKTPEGKYRINDRNPNSAYHKNLGVSYPNEADKAYAAAQGKSPGGLIKIHGIKNGWGSIGKRHLQRDWTDGCIAVTDEEIDELYRSVKHNAEIEILP